MNKLLVRLCSLILTLSSTPTVAQSFDDSLGNLISALKDVDLHMADTGFEMDKDKYAFGAKRVVDKDTSINMGLGGRMKYTPEYDLSNNYRGVDSQTNMIEQDPNPIKATPMLGMSFTHKF